MHSKRIVAVFIILLFCTTLAIGSSAVFSIAEINTEYSLISEEQKNKTNEIEEALKNLSGKNIVFVKKNEIHSLLESFTYIKIGKVIKNYPNILKVEVIERLEVFALKSENGWFMLDNGGFVLTERSSNSNNIDGLANIQLLADANAKIGGLCAPVDKMLFDNCLKTTQIVADFFNLQPRQVLDSIEIDALNINFKLKGGFDITIQDASELLFEKIDKALSFYNDSTKMTQEMKANKYGRIIAHKFEGGVRAVYTISNNL